MGFARVLGLILVGAGIATLTTIGCKVRAMKAPDEFRVALQTLPGKLEPRTDKINVHQYVLMHLYHPLFSRLPDGGLESAFLDMGATRALDNGFKRFQLCLKPGLKFASNRAVEPADLKRSLEESHKVLTYLPALSSVRIEASCVAVELERRDSSYFHHLATIRSTILGSADIAPGIPDGVGPYKVDAIEQDRIALSAVSAGALPDISRIEFVRMTGDLNKYGKPVHDWNHLYHIPVPDELIRGFSTVRRPLLKTYYLLVNLPRREDRVALARCFPRKEFVREIGLSLEDTPGFLPKGLPGSSVNFDEIVAGGGPACPVSRPAVYMNYNESQGKAVAKFFEARFAALKIKMENRSLDETIKAAYSRTTMITIVGVDTATPDAVEFFSAFTADKPLGVEPVPGLRDALASASAADDPQERVGRLTKAHRLLLESGTVIPLGQLVAVHRYPDWVRELVVGDPVHGFPRIDLIKVR